MFPEVQTEYPALSGRKNAISFRKLVESSGLYEKRSLCPDFIATFVAGHVSGSSFLSVSRPFNVTLDPPIAGNDFTGFELSHIDGTI